MQVDTVSVAAGQVYTKTYTVSVSDGQLTLRLKDLGGNDPSTVINGLEIGDSTAAAVGAGDIAALDQLFSNGADDLWLVDNFE